MIQDVLQRVRWNINQYRKFLVSAISRAILRLVYMFGIPNSDLQILKSVDFWYKLSLPLNVAEPREDVLSYSECKIANFGGGAFPDIFC